MLYLVPSLVLFLATHPAVKKEHLQSVRTIISGGALASRSIIEKFNQKAQKEIDFRQGMFLISSFVSFMQERMDYGIKFNF